MKTVACCCGLPYSTGKDGPEQKKAAPGRAGSKRDGWRILIETWDTEIETLPEQPHGETS
jgi:hypothetical protein